VKPKRMANRSYPCTTTCPT